MSNKTGVSDTIYQCIVDLRERNRVATRQVVADLTGLKLAIVDDHIKRMKDDGKIRMVVAGVFEPAEDSREDRAISATFLPNNLVKVEVGDVVLDLSMREARALGMAMGGVFLQFAR